MQDSLKLKTELTTEDPEEIKQAIDQYLKAIERIHEEMVKDQVEIDRLQVETRVMLDQLRKAA